MQKDLDRRYETWEAFSLDLAEAFRSENLGEQSEEVADSEKFNTLRALSFFDEFSDAELWEVMRISSWEHHPGHTLLIQDGDKGEFFCVVAEGEGKVTKRGKLLNVLGAGECFGEMAYLSRTGNQRLADVSANVHFLAIGLEHLADQRRGRRLAVGAGDGDQRLLDHAARELDLVGDRDLRLARLFERLQIEWNARAHHDELGRLERLRVVLTEFVLDLEIGAGVASLGQFRSLFHVRHGDLCTLSGHVLGDGNARHSKSDDEDPLAFILAHDRAHVRVNEFGSSL